MKSVRDIPVKGLTVFVRVDFNVPLDDKGNITEDGRIKAALTTIEFLLQQGAKVVLASHMGRPKGKVVESLRMAPVAHRLGQLLGQTVHYVDDCIGSEVEKVKARLQPGEVMLLENLRFYDGEKKNDLAFAQALAEGIDVYINDAFGALHRKHASVHALPSLIFDKGIGFLIREELDALSRVIRNPDQPLVVVIGGAKISDKVDVIRNLAPLGDIVLTGGGVANAFIKGNGYDVQQSLVESDSVSEDQEGVDYSQVALEICHRFSEEKPTIDVAHPNGGELPKVVYPVDGVCSPSTEEGAEVRVIDFATEQLPEGWLILDIGPKTQQLYAQILSKAQTIFWNGPMGLFEQDAYAHGSRAVAQAVAECKGYTVLGGGDTEVVVEKFGFGGKFSHISTGGGASLTYLAERPLPGLETLE